MSVRRASAEGEDLCNGEYVESVKNGSFLHVSRGRMVDHQVPVTVFEPLTPAKPDTGLLWL